MRPCSRDYHMRFRVNGLSTPFLLTLGLKDPLMEDATVYTEFLLTNGVIRWNKLPGCWQLKDKKILNKIINVHCNTSFILCCHGALLWPFFCDYHMHFLVVCLSVPSVPTLCLEDPQMDDDTVYMKLLLTVGWFVGTVCIGVVGLKTRKTLCQQLTIIYWYTTV